MTEQTEQETQQPDGKSDYYQKWYGRNRATLSTKRKARYRDDPVYRAAQAERTKKWRQARRAANPPQRHRVQHTVSVEGQQVNAYLISEVAKRTGKSVVTLNSWERAGYMPLTPFRNERGDRLYTDAMIEVLVRVIAGRKKVDMKGVFERQAVRNGWCAAGVNIP